jgi:ABC-type sugar transport system substrate-binding protein
MFRNRMLKVTASLALLALVLALVAGCVAAPAAAPAAPAAAQPTAAPAAAAAQPTAAAAAAPAAADKKIVLGAVQMVAFHEWFRTIEMGMKAAADKYGAELVVANAEGQVDKEASMVENFTTRPVDAIMISALDSKASVKALQNAVDKGVVLVDYNTTIDSPIMENFIGVDNTELGAQAGRYVLDYVKNNMGNKATVALLTIPKYDVGKQRREGFVAEVSKNPDIKIVAEQEGESPEQGANTLESILQAHPDVNLVWAANEGGAVGALTATKGKGDKIKIVGTDMSLQTAKALLDPASGLVAVSTQDPYMIGYTAAETAIKLLKGEEVKGDADNKILGQTVKRKITIPVAMYEKAKADAVQQYLDKYKSLAAQ